MEWRALSMLLAYTVYITLHTQHVQVEAIRFEVQDDGCGISESEQRLLFMPFHQLKAGAAQKNNGTGLGLS
jgi:signal transduction histidine kinase